MEQLRSRHWIPAAFVLTLALFLVLLSAVALNLNLARMRDSFAWVRHTNEVLTQVAVIDGDLVEAEATERGYLLTGDEDTRQVFERLHDTLPSLLTALRDLVPDNPPQRELLEQLQPLLITRLDELRQVVVLGPENGAAALASLRASKLHRLTRTIRERLQVFRSAELDLLGERQEEAAEGMTWSIASAAATTILALISASFAMFLFRRARALQRERELRAELIHVSRLNMMGQMASMLAHELNQPLTATGNYLRSMLRLTEAEPTPRSGLMLDALTRSVAQMDRAREIVRRLRDFITKGEPAKTMEPVGSLIDDAVALLGMGRDRFTVSHDVAPGLPAVLADKIQIEQVLINLMRNAVEAMEPNEHRVVTLVAREAGRMVRIEVRDTGPGIPREVMERLFRPFTTTKSGGMGVGLSICQTIVLANGGRIWTEPNPEGGTVFCFTLPAAPSAETAAAPVTDGFGDTPDDLGPLSVSPGI